MALTFLITLPLIPSHPGRGNELMDANLDTKLIITHAKIPSLLIIIILVLDLWAIFAQTEWELVKDKDEVKIYAREIKAFAGKEFKGVSFIDQSIEIVGAVLFDIPAYTKWFHNCLEIKKIPHADSTDLDFILYVAIDAPWPLWDRDSIYKTNAVLNIASGKIKIHGVAIREPLLPFKDHYIRITSSELEWILEEMADKKTKVTFIKRTNIGGAAGDYFSNMGSKMAIFDSLVNLRIMTREPKYKELGKKLRETYTQK
jgi:hypothetical protein